jgi:hypothetical protein
MCGPGLRCEYAIHEPDTTYSYKCVALPAETEPCYLSTCGPGLVCNTSNTCARPGQANAPCATSTQCAEGLACDSETGTCVAPKAAGEECTSTLDCGPNLTCHSYYGSCRPRTGLGDSCLRNEQCVEGTECLLESNCEPRAQLDEKCEADHPCAPGLRCDMEWGVCKLLADPPLSSGQRCHVNADCLSGSCVANICTGLCQGVGD